MIGSKDNFKHNNSKNYKSIKDNNHFDEKILEEDIVIENYNDGVSNDNLNQENQSNVDIKSVIPRETS